MCHTRPFVDPITFSKPNHEDVYLTEMRNLISNKMAIFLWHSQRQKPPENLGRHRRVCV
jgi:hypothetical protein